MTSCVQCGATAELQRDHIIPRHKGGTDDPSNIQVLCRTCHREKTRIDMSGPRPPRRRKQHANEIFLQQLQGGSMFIRVPGAIAEAHGYRKGEVFYIYTEGDKIIIQRKDTPTPSSIPN